MIFLITVICTGLFGVQNHVTMPPDVEVSTGYAIPYTGYRRSPGDTVGMTDYDWQANGSMGRYVWITPSGGYSFYWTYRYGGSNANRRAYYNYHHPPSYWLGPTSMDTRQSRMGSMDQMANGRALGAAHATTTGTNTESCVYLDAAEGAGTFTVIAPPWAGDPATNPSWPRVVVDSEDHIFIVASQNGGPYSYWNMSTNEGVTWLGWDSILGGVVLNVLNYDYGGHELWAQYGSKIALVNNMGYDYFTIVYWESDDLGITWSYDTIYCLPITPGDSVQGYLWNSAVYDNNGCLHVALTCIDTIANGGGASGSGWRSQIRHWNQETDQISLVDNGTGWINSNPGPGNNHPTNSEPQIAIDRATSDLYCTWCHADPADTAHNGMVNMDIWGAKSTDNGTTWIEHHNITNSPSPGAFPGYCDNDHMNHLAEVTLGDTLVLFYLNDKDAGVSAFPPYVTDNPLLFYLYRWNPPGIQEHNTAMIEKLNIFVSPNPFSRSTKIIYTLPNTCNVSLRFYSIDGRMVKTIYDRNEAAGVHQEILDLSGIANGIYCVVLETATGKESCSVVVIH
jgi:hypothetical protein